MIHTHPDQPEMQAEVILASQGPSQKPIYTIRLRYPRIIHSEIMTHRVFSRNARSSRAVPVSRMIEEIRTKPFIPWHWGKNQKGMQADEECNELVVPSHWFSKGGLSRTEAWLHACNEAIDIAEAFMDAGYHKQIANRLLEPFMWIDTLITSTEWSNFLWLRDHKDAEPHLQDLARLVEQAINGAPLLNLEIGQWHLPYITKEDLIALLSRPEAGTSSFTDLVCKISAARCARISYAPFDGNASYERELERYESLVSSDRIHASPLEHQATPDSVFYDDADGLVYDNPDHHGNLNDYIQFRKTVPGENHDD